MKRPTTTEIANITGFSRGTVDRVLHNRGNVSAEALEKIKKVLEDSNYTENIHTSAVPYKKLINLLICLPNDTPDDFWSLIRKGIRTALEEYSDIDIHCHDLDFSPFDEDSFSINFHKALEQKIDGVILSSIFPAELKKICNVLDSEKIPYIFVDKALEGSKPHAIYSVDLFASGIICAKVTDILTPKNSEIAFFFANRSRKHTEPNCHSRLSGVEHYWEQNKDRIVYYSEIDISTDQSLSSDINVFMKEHPDVKGIAVTNAHGCRVADALQNLGYKDIIVTSFDMTKGNAEALKDGRIQAIFSQKSETQGYKATIEMIRYIFYRKDNTKKCFYQPIDVIFKENLPWYKDLDH